MLETVLFQFLVKYTKTKLLQQSWIMDVPTGHRLKGPGGGALYDVSVNIFCIFKAQSSVKRKNTTNG